MANKILIKGTFLDEISHDIPHQNWGEKEWSLDFKYMKSVGIDKVILIRCGYKNWITFPSQVLTIEEKAIHPQKDLVSMFLRLSKENDMDFISAYMIPENIGLRVIMKRRLGLTAN